MHLLSFDMHMFAIQQAPSRVCYLVRLMELQPLDCVGFCWILLVGAANFRWIPLDCVAFCSLFCQTYDTRHVKMLPNDWVMKCGDACHVSSDLVLILRSLTSDATGDATGEVIQGRQVLCQSAGPWVVAISS